MRFLSFAFALAAVHVGATPVPLKIWFNGKATTATAPVITLGRVVTGEIIELQLDVENASDLARTVSVAAEGPIHATWTQGSAAMITIPQREKQSLAIRLTIPPADHSPLLAFYLWNAEGLSSFVTFDYEAFDSDEVVVTAATGTVVSPAGGDYSDWFHVCTGPSPPGYALTTCEFNLTGQRDKCGKWSRCDQSQGDDNSVCFRFKIQGHKETQFGGGVYKETRSANGKLTSRYRLLETAPQIHDALPVTAPDPPVAGAFVRCRKR